MKAPEFPPILAAEDEESDRLLIKLAHERCQIRHPLVLVNNGQECVDYFAELDGRRRLLPALILLDLKMPRLTGFDVLIWLGIHPPFTQIPAVVLSSSFSELDIQRARHLGARDYLVKPHAMPDWQDTFRKLAARWLSPPPASATALAPKLPLQE